MSSLGARLLPNQLIPAIPDDEDFEWEPPTAAEMKVIEARRERQDKISKIMGDYLLKGFKMLGDCCETCGVSSALLWCLPMLYNGFYVMV